MFEQVQNLLAFGMPQGMDWVWIFLIILIVFGGKKLPELARSIGRGLNQFKKGLHEVEDEKDEILDEVKKVNSDTSKPLDNTRTNEPKKTN